MSKTDALRDAAKIDGWLTEREAEALYDLAQRSTGPIVEIGSCYGRSTAAIARGSMAGNKQPVFAVDSFVGVFPADRPTSNGEQPGWGASSPEILRANLDAAGVNGLVTIVAKASHEATEDVPDGLGLLFIDGAHDFDSVRRDIGLYAPKVRVGGKIVMHDATTVDPGVLEALDVTLTADTKRWQPVCRVDSAVVYERRQDTERFKVFLAMPGPNLKYCAAAGLMTASQGVHDVTPRNSGNGWDDMNVLWVEALNAAQRGEVTHFAMLHSDIHPSPGWVDTLASEMVRVGADMISATVALKDPRGLSSTGVGSTADPWNAFRRFTMRELHEMPETFSIADTTHPERYLLHNTGCWLADLRNPAWRKVGPGGFLVATFSFPVAAQLMPDGTIEHRRESEDWYFSRQIAGLPLKTFATRKVTTAHYGDTPYVNNKPWGDYLFGDEATRSNWEPK
jgi:predicted O-methyltransferase YrrM